jgi:class 3 adenylate cyclase/tetratricopeptide (TPR) repeat protein
MAVCRSCAAELLEGARFCPACGAPVSARGGEERKVVTVLFADLVDSTAQADRCDPEDVRAAVRPQLMRIREELERHGGTFEKYVGDAVMAVFGAPVAHEDDPERAVRAALAIRDALEGVRVAVNTGEAVVTLSAGSGAGEGIATGDVVNTTFRIEEAARDNTVLVGEPTYRATQSVIEYGDPTMLQAKGKAASVPVYEALRTRSELRTPLERRAPLAPLVGRKQELSLIIDTLALAKRDSSVQLMTLLGVPGIGKSRLLWELERALEGDPGLVTWRRGRCLPYGDGVTYWALGEMVKAQAGILETDDADAAHGKLARSVRDLLADEREAAHVEGHLRPLVGLAHEAPERREEAFAAWRRFLEALAQWGPLVLAFEDLHWADDGMLDFLDDLSDRAYGPLLLLCTARPELRERRPSWGARPNVATVALAPLTEQETGLLLGFLLRDAVVPDELLRTLRARAQGNPLFTEELVRVLVHDGLLGREGGTWRLGDGELPLPESVHGLIAARLDSLPPDEKGLLHDASILGPTFWVGGLASMSGRSRAAVEQDLRSLERKQLVRRQRTSTLAGDDEYVFHHALACDVAYAQVPRAERVRRHVDAAGWLERLGRTEDRAETIAHHYHCAVELSRDAGLETAAFAGKARHWLSEAAARAVALTAPAAAVRYLTAALELWAEDDADRYELLLRLGRAQMAATGDGAQALELAVDGLRHHGRRSAAADAEILLARVAWLRGNRDGTRTHTESAKELVRGEPPSPEKARVLAGVASMLMLEDVFEDALETAGEALELSRSLGLVDVEGQLLSTIGSTRVRWGDSEGIEDLERSVDVLSAADSPTLGLAYQRLAAAHVEQGDLRRAAELHVLARNLTERGSDEPSRVWLLAERVGELYWSGRWDEATAVADQFLAQVEAGEHHYLESFCRCLRGQIRLARGDVAGAVNDAERALAAAAEAGDSQVVLPARAFRARVRASEGDRVAAADEAVAALADLSGRESGEHCWVDFAMVLDEAGRGDELVRLLENGPKRTRWREAAIAFARGRYSEAAELYAAIGSRPDADVARERAARTLAGPTQGAG